MASTVFGLIVGCSEELEKTNGLSEMSEQLEFPLFGSKIDETSDKWVGAAGTFWFINVECLPI